jgi:asparagine synthetase B (glutamine-hydrolysing)
VEQVFDRVSQLHEPFDMGMVLHFLLYQQAASKGHRFMLDGVDGDVSTGLSYNYPVQLFRQKNFKAACKETCLQSRIFFEGTISPQRLLARYALSAFTPQVLKDWRWKYKLPSNMRKTLEDSVVSESFAQKTQLVGRLKQFERTHRKSNLIFPQEHYLCRVRHPFLTVGLERYDRVASLCSIEPRHPLLDKRLIEFYLGLPWHQFMQKGWSKFLFRRVAAQFIPGEVCWRTGKEHVGYQFIKELLHRKNESIHSLGYLQKDTLKRMVKADFPLDQPRSDMHLKRLKKLANQIDIAGITLWLNNI